jgi:hypothetical protein
VKGQKSHRLGTEEVLSQGTFKKSLRNKFSCSFNLLFMLGRAGQWEEEEGEREGQRETERVCTSLTCY